MRSERRGRARLWLAESCRVSDSDGQQKPYPASGPRPRGRLGDLPRPVMAYNCGIARENRHDSGGVARVLCFERLTPCRPAAWPPRSPHRSRQGVARHVAAESSVCTSTVLLPPCGEEHPGALLLLRVQSAASRLRHSLCRRRQTDRGWWGRAVFTSVCSGQAGVSKGSPPGTS